MSLWKKLQKGKKARRERRLRTQFMDVAIEAISDIADQGIEPTVELVAQEMKERIEDNNDRPLISAFARLIDWFRESGLLELLIRQLL